MAKKISFKIEIAPDNKIKAFGCYLSPSAKEGKALIRLNFNAILGCCIEEKLDLYEILSEVTAHELIHALEDIFKKQFNERKVRKLIEVNTKNYKKSLKLRKKEKKS